MISRALASLTRVAVEPPEVRGCPGPRFLRRISRRASRLAGEPMCLGFEVAERRYLSPPRELAASLNLPEPPLLEVRNYSLGFTSVRITFKAQPNASTEEYLELWRAAARWADERLDSLLRGRMNLSRQFSVVQVIEDGSVEDEPPELLFGLTAPLLPRLVSRGYAESRGRLEHGMFPGDVYYLTPSGAVVQVGSVGRHARYARRRLRRYLELAVDVVLAQEVAFTNPAVTMSGDGLFKALVHLSPDLWRSGLVVRERPLIAIYGRIAGAVGVDRLYSSLLSRLRTLLTSEQLRSLMRAKSVAYRLGLPLGVEEPVKLVEDDCFSIIDVLALKHAIDSRGLDPERAVDLMAIALPWRIDPDDLKRIKRSVASREDFRGLTATEMARLLPSISQTRLYGLLAGECPPGWVIQRRVGRQGSGRREVLIYEANASVDIVRALVAGWASTVDRMLR
mgnify:CR=1 FL=1